LEKLEKLYPGLRDKICDEQGAFRRYVNIFVNEENVPHNNAHKASLKSGDTVYILPSIAGGN
jgi:molybdopterin synthase sulfur carrier subunit